VDKSLFFLFLSLLCVWLIIDAAVGSNKLGSFLGTIFPFMASGETAAERPTLEVSENFKDHTTRGQGFGNQLRKENLG